MEVAKLKLKLKKTSTVIVDRGNVPAMGLWITYSAVQFQIFAWTQSLSSQEWTPVYDVIGGSLAGLGATMVSYPFDYVRTSLAVQSMPKRFPTMLAMTRSIFNDRGIHGFYRGSIASSLQVAPYAGVSLSVYQTIHNHCEVSSSTSGAAAGFLAKLVVYPMDTVKKRFQTSLHHQSIFKALLSIMRDEGLFGFYKGTLPALTKAALSASITFQLYEWALAALRRDELV